MCLDQSRSFPKPENPVASTLGSFSPCPVDQIQLRGTPWATGWNFSAKDRHGLAHSPSFRVRWPRVRRPSGRRARRRGGSCGPWATWGWGITTCCGESPGQPCGSWSRPARELRRWLGGGEWGGRGLKGLEWGWREFSWKEFGRVWI